MPKSKRFRPKLTSQVEKKPERKVSLVNEIRECVDKYKYIYVFEVYNEKNLRLKEVRSEWTSSRIFLGRNKLMMYALGRSEDEEYKELLHMVGNQLAGHTGLLFTDVSEVDVVNYFDNYRIKDFATAGFVPSETVVVNPGRFGLLTPSIEPYLRELGMVTELKDGIVKLLSEYRLAKEGSPISPEQSRALKLFGIMMSEFRINLKCVWSAGSFRYLASQVPEDKSRKSSKRKSKKESNTRELDPTFLVAGKSSRLSTRVTKRKMKAALDGGADDGDDVEMNS